MIKILIVDDSLFSQKTTAMFLKKYLSDITVLFANNGEEGLLKYQELKPDYVFADLLMPKIDGKELILRIKKQDSNAKIFVVSADVQKNVKNEIDSYDIMGFVNKPFSDEKAQSICQMIKDDQNVRK